MDGIELAKAFATKREDISYVIQNGSRVNPRIVPDRYADYDLIFGCADPEPYLRDRGWISEFGSLLIAQVNEIEERGLFWPIFLMQFEGGLRVDAQFYPGDGAAKYRGDSLSRIVLDKRGLLGPSFAPSENSYIVRAPGADEYVKTVNEFWWCMLNVAKGIVRGETSYARFMYESVVRSAYLDIVSWHASMRRGWSVNAGKFGKFLRDYLEPEIWAAFEASYHTDSPADFWASIYAACALVERLDAELRPMLAPASEAEDTVRILRFLKLIEEGKL
jgi:Streptomycin adenylyltransferase.